MSGESNVSGKREDKREAHIQQSIRLALGLEPDLDLERRTVGKTEEWNPKTGKARVIRYGTPGEADLQGILGPHGRFFALEVKRPGERPTDAQVTWANRKRRYGGFVAVVTSVDEARAALARAREGADR